jgi:hypothetical protein
MITIIVKTKDGQKHKMEANDWEMAYRTIGRLKKHRYKKILAYGKEYKVKFKLEDDEKVDYETV